MNAGVHARWNWQRPGFSLDVELELPGRGISALFGPSGSGKTTCLRAMAGLERIHGGFLQVNGECWQDESSGRFVTAARRAVGYVPQDASLFAHLNVLANLQYGWRRSGQRRGHGAVQDHELVALLGIGGLLERMPAQLSGGERQRVAIARALLTQPKMLLLDEPLSALDGARKAEFLPYLESLHASLSIPVIYVSHAVEEVARLADFVVLLDDGRVVAQGPVQQTMSRIDLADRYAEGPAVVFEAEVVALDSDDHLAHLRFAGGELFVPLRNERLGQRLRCRIQARDVSLVRDQPTDSSILNLLAAQVVEIGGATHPAQVLVRLDAGGTPLLACITTRSARKLDLHSGMAVWAQVKSAAVLA